MIGIPRSRPIFTDPVPSVEIAQRHYRYWLIYTLIIACVFAVVIATFEPVFASVFAAIIGGLGIISGTLLTWAWHDALGLAGNLRDVELTVAGYSCIGDLPHKFERTGNSFQCVRCDDGWKVHDPKARA